MSVLRTTGSLGFSRNKLTYNDDRVQPPDYSSRSDVCGQPNILWPRTKLIAAGMTNAEACLNNTHNIWDWEPFLATTSGIGQNRDAFIGVTRDANSAALGNAVVEIYRTLTDERVDRVTSDASGNYIATTPYTGEQHYAVAYKAGSPDIFGTTVNTLVGV